MAKSSRKALLEWIVTLRVEREVRVYVEAATSEEATRKAKEWDIVGDEEPGDTIDCEIKKVERNT